MWLSEKGRAWLDRWFFLSIAFLLVFIPAAIRYDVGTDYLNYLDIYQGGRADDRLEVYKNKEPLFYFVNWFYRSFNAHFQWVFATLSFVFTAVAFKAYPRNKGWLIHFLFFSMLWFFSFNGMRQAVALSWCLLALVNFFDRRYIRFLIFTLIGVAFHQSVLFVAVAGFMALIPLSFSFKGRIAPVFFIGFIVLTYMSMSVVLVYLEQALTLVGLTKYAGYFSSSIHFVERDFGSGIGVLAKVLFSIYIIFCSNAFLRINKNYWLLIILVFAYAIGVVLANKVIIFGRMADTFSIAPIVGAFLLLQLPKHQKLNRVVLASFLVFLTLSFVKMSVGAPTSYGDPKHNPYRTIFELHR